MTDMGAVAGSAPVRIDWRRIAPVLGGLSALVVVIVVFSALKPDTFATTANLKVIVSQSAVAAILAAGLSVSLIAGVFDLSFTATLSLAAIVVAALINGGMPWPLAVLVALLVASAVGVVNGLLVVVARVPSLVATLGMQSVLSGIVIWATNSQYITLHPTGFTGIGRSTVIGIPTETVIMVGLLLVAAVVMRHVTVGRNLQAVGRNAEASRFAGIRVNGYVVGSLVVTALFAGIAAMIVTAKLGAGHPEIGPGYLLPAFAAAFLGGAVNASGSFSIAGALYGAVLLTTLSDGLVIADAPDWTQQAVTGIVLLVAVSVSRILRRTSTVE
jgi:ribose transport system permease protein